jgi:hypothetical protein
MFGSTGECLPFFAAQLEFNVLFSLLYKEFRTLKNRRFLHSHGFSVAQHWIWGWTCQMGGWVAVAE